MLVPAHWLSSFVAVGLFRKHRASQECEAIGHRWWEVTPKCHVVGSGLSARGGREWQDVAVGRRHITGWRGHLQMK